MSLFSHLFVGDGFCDDDLNIPECSYDGYDCCDINSDFNLCNYCICHEIHLTTDPFTTNMPENTTLDDMVEEEELDISLFILSFNQSSSTSEGTSTSTGEKTTKKSTTTPVDSNEGKNSSSRWIMNVILYPILILIILF